MITPAYCQMMARYNAWQNSGLRRVVDAMEETELRQDRGAFFGSLTATLNHLLWGDLLWISRFDGGEGPVNGIKDSVNQTPTTEEWSVERLRTDSRISEWARKLRASDLIGDYTWFSGAAGREVTKPSPLVVTHFFNHQTHHRGQIHAMLTAAGQMPQDTDLFYLPETDTWR